MAVTVDVLFRLSRSSKYQGGLPPVVVLTVTPPLPGCVVFTVRLTVVMRVPVMPVAVPLMVTGNVPVVAVADAVNVTVLVAPVAGLGLAVTVTPAGWPLAARVTAPVKPPVRVMVTVLVAAAPPCVTLTAAGLADSVKLGVCGGVTGRLTVVMRVPVMPVAVPLIVTGTVPVAAVAEAVNVAVLVAPVAGLGLKVTVTPVCWPLAESVTAPVKPPVRVMVTVLAAEAPPCAMLTADGFAESVKFGVCAGFTVRVTVVMREPLMPVAVPLRVTGNVPVVADAEAVNVTVLVPPVAGFGLAVTVTPAGWPVALKVTAPVKPPLRVMVTVLL